MGAYPLSRREPRPPKCFAGFYICEKARARGAAQLNRCLPCRSLFAFGRFRSTAPLVDVDAGTLKNLKFGVPAEPFWGPIRSIGASLGPQNGSAGFSFLKERARARVVEPLMCGALVFVVRIFFCVLCSCAGLSAFFFSMSVCVFVGASRFLRRSAFSPYPFQCRA